MVSRTVVLLVVPACNALVGIQDVPPAPDASVSEAAGGSSTSSGSGASSGSGTGSSGAGNSSSGVSGSSGSGSRAGSSSSSASGSSSSGSGGSSGSPGGDGGTTPDGASEDGCAAGAVLYYEPFTGAAPGWTLDSTWTAASECASPPIPDKGYPDPTTDHTSMTAGGGVIGVYVCGNNPKTVSPALYATSPPVDVSAAPTLMLTFYRWLNSDQGAYMTSTVDVFDGSTWRNVYQNPSSGLVTDNAWTKQEYDVTAYKNAALKVRFGYSITSSSVYAVSCWNVDDVTLSTTSCP